MEAPLPTNLTKAQKRNMRRSNAKKNGPSVSSVDHVEINSNPDTTIEPSNYITWVRLSYLCKIMSLLVLGKGTMIELETRVRGNTLKDFWLLVRINRFENKNPNPIDYHAIKNLSIEDYTAALFLYEKALATGKVWIAMHTTDNFLLIRNDRFLYTEGNECRIPYGVLSDKYQFMLFTDMGTDLKPKEDKKFMLVISNRESGNLEIPTNIVYWNGHHNKESLYYVCDR